MDSVEEDVSARVLLRNVLHSEPARSPVTRSVARNATVSLVRRSSRVRNTPGNESPQVALRKKLKQKLHESATQSPLPPSKRPRSQGRAVKTPAVASSSLYDEDITPRGLLRGIIQTEAEASLLLSGQPAVPEANQQIVETSLHSNRQSEGPSGLELPDLVTEPLSTVIRGMSRRRPPPTFNVSAFERQLDQQTGEEENDVTQENTEETVEQDLSAGCKSVLSLTLKTPFMNVQSERVGLRRKAATRRQPSVDAFDEAVQKRFERHCNQDYTVVQDGKTLGDSDWQKFTLGLSNVTMPDLTTDIVMSNTELYLQPTVSASVLKDDDDGPPEVGRCEDGKAYETNRMGGEHQEEQVVDDFQDKLNEHLSKVCETEPEPFQEMEDPETVSQIQEEKEGLDVIPSSQENEPVSLSPEELPFAPTQAMTEPVPQIQEHEGKVSDIQESEVEKSEMRESEEELPSQVLERITRRAYHSEGGAVVAGITARGRSTKSLGAEQYPTGKELQSFTNASAAEELPHLHEEPNISPASASTSPTMKPYLSEMHQTSLAEVQVDEVEDHTEGNTSKPFEMHQTSLAEVQDDEVKGVTQGDNSMSEDENIVTSPGHHSPTPDLPADEEEQQEEDDEEDAHSEGSEELSMQTPAFIRQRKEVPTPGTLRTPTVLKVLNTGPAPKVVKPRPRQKTRPASHVLPKSYVMSVFKHFAKTKVASDVYPVINEILQKYFDRLADDLEAYSAHAKRKTIEIEDVELLMRRQGFVTDSAPVNVLIEKFLPLEYRKLLIPVATSGNKVIPNQRR
ncbi:centromere protein T isoform X1 [Pygocentrus nattereri]|uniref:centromere protein T isoform X1 n=1 Tax=Pygocentrus nattereri TaxID=42514 RepID=UPI0008147EC7|nr:centromere protein T isoform X1 [Pygocentrus nattereri]